jgi:NAD(P)-dependent dehydrogenase (short-subunit alcohol dehydrogenase family)
MNYADYKARAQEVVREITSAGGQAVAVQADVANAAEVEWLFKQTLHTFGMIEVVVNSAGIMPLGRIAGGDIDCASRRTSRTSCHSLRVPMGSGSTAKCCAPKELKVHSD